MPAPRTTARIAAVAVLAVLAALLTYASPAAAIGCTPISDFPAPPPNAPLPGSCFEGYDGNQLDPDGATPLSPAAPNRLDWGSTEVLNDGQRALDYVDANGDSQFTGGSEEVPDSWSFGVGSIGSDKYNFISGYSYSEENTDDLMLALAFVRESNNGTSWLAFELNQELPGYRTTPLAGATPAQTVDVPTRTSGDLLITYSVSNNNTPKPVIGLCKWVGDEHVGVWTNMSGVPVASNCPPLGAAVAQADMNGADILPADNKLGSPAGLLEAGRFGEASINLTEAFKAAGGNPNTDDDCLSFGYFWAHSRASEPITAAQKDVILPTDAINVANCAVEGTKWHDKNGNGLLDGTDEELGGWTIFADYDNDGVKDPLEPSDVTSDGTDGRPVGFYSLTKLADGTYPIREVAKAGWLCTSPDPIDTSPTATDPTAPSLCATEVDMTGSVIDGVDFLNFEVKPAIKLTKTATLVAAGASPVVGDKVTYGFEIENTGNVTLTGVDLDDDLLGYTDVTCNLTTSLAPGAKVSCSGDHLLTQAEIDAGSVKNNADACGDPPVGLEVCSPDDTTTPLVADPKILLEKSAVLVAAGASPVVGDKVTYTFKITNTGNVTLDGVDLDDNKLGYTNVVCNLVTVLAPGGTTTCSGDYLLTQSDIDAGSVKNDADACGDSPKDVEVCSPDDTTTTLLADPKILLEKSAQLVTAGANPVAGDKVTYTFKITNQGNVTLDGVDLDDDLLGYTDVVCNLVTVLAPGASTTCTGDHVLTQSDINAGKVDNTAKACGDSPKDVEVCSTDGTSTPLASDKSILLEKSAQLVAAGASPVAGDKVTYTFKITNTGNVTLTGVDLDDDLLGYANVVCNLVTVLSPTQSTTCTGDYVLKQSDVDAGSVKNNADACGDPPVGVEICSIDDTTTTLVADPKILLEKSALLVAAGANPVAGDKVTYTFKITNTGNVTLDGVDLDDDLLGYANVVCNLVTVLAPGASTTCTGDYVLKQSDVDAGSVKNNADACGDSPKDVEVCSPDDTTTTLAADPKILLEKSAVLNAGAAPKAGDTITYTFKITNTGNVTLDGVDLDDALVALNNAVCNAVTVLAPGASTTCTKTYTLTQADIDAGKVDNTADACGDSPKDVEVCSIDTTSTPLAADPKILLDKTAVLNAGAAPKAGDTITYTFKITNTGNVVLDGVDLDDALAGLDNAVCNGVTVLAPGASTTCTKNYTLTQADVDAGKVDNTADACGDSPKDVEVCSIDTTSTPLAADPKIALDKSAVLNAGATPKTGDTITYTFKITNTGNVTLSGVDLDDALAGLDNAVCNAVTVLAPGASTTCTKSYTLKQSDIDAGKVDNTADACGDSPKQVEVCSIDTTSTPLAADPKIDLEKFATLNLGGNGLQAGDTITYEFVITNVGNVTLSGVDLDDALVALNNAVCNAVTVLAPGAKTTCSKTYTVTQADIDAGKVDNSAKACGDSPKQVEVCDTDTTSTPLDPNKAIQLKKTGLLKSVGAPKPGDTITYTFEITNIGNVTLTGVDLDDALAGKDNAVCGDPVLSPGESTSCTADYTITQADIDRGSVTNVADACGDSPAPVTEVCDDDTTTTQLPADPKIDLDKSATLNTGGDGLQAGDTVTYKFVITNVGNVTLDGVDLDDALLGLTDAVCNAVTVLAPGASTTCTKDYTLTQADIDAGKVDNDADACGDSPKQVEVCAPDNTSTPLNPEKGIQLKKTGLLKSVGAPKPGDTITYTFEITNIGNVTLTGVDLDDALVGKDNAVCGDTTLSPDEVTTCTADYSITQADIDAGKVDNLADACGDSPAPVTEVCDDDTTSTPLAADPKIALDKTAVLNAQSPKAGDTVTYAFEVTNTGNVTLDGVDLDDALVGYADKTCGKTVLAPGEKTTCTVDYTLTQADVDAGKVSNKADACGDSPKDVEVCGEDETTTPLPASPSINLKKTAALNTPVNPKAGDTITYAFEITNTGNVTLSGSDLDDALVGFANAACGAATLAPGAKATCTAQYALTQDDVDAGTVTNTAKACADPPNDAGEVCDEDTTTTPLEPNKGILVVKDGPATVYHGDQATYTFLVSNTGNVTLTGVKVSDDKCAPVQGPVAFVKGDDDAKLEVGEQWKYTCTMPVAAHAAGEANPIVNTVTATGTDPRGATLTDTDTHSTKVLHAAVQIDKTGPGTAEAGQRVMFALVVTNPGDTPLLGEKVGVTDSKCDSMPVLSAKKRGDGDDPTPNTLDPGDSWVYTCSVPTAAGQQSLLNVASVVADDVNGRKVTDDDDFTTPLTQPQIAVLPEVIVSGAANLRGPSRCVSKAFTARVTGKRIKSVSWFVDGKKVKTFNSTTGEATRANLRVNPARYGKGVHRLRARITFADASRTTARTLRMTFQKCAKRIIAPKFTG